MSIYPPTGTLEIKNATLRIPVVDLQYTSNTAKLEANSNVVTEFSRSKKLIKYPRVLLTSAALNSAYENGYRVTFSSENTSYRAYHPFSRDENSAVGWHSSNGTTGAPYDGTGGLYGTSGTARLAAETERGEWLGLELPVAIKLERLRMVSQNYSPAVNTIDDFIVYAKKQSGDTWTNIGTFTGIAPLQTSADGAMFDVNAVEYYKFFAIVATKRDAAGAGSGVSIRVLEYFGVPEYDPDADGTDVTLKSLANVPNTDWLEIYYDAKDLEDGAVTSVSALGGTTNGGTAVGDTQVSNGAFVFDGSGDYIYNSQSGYTSRVVYTGCAWIKKASATNGCIFQFGTGSNNSGIGLFSFGSPSETKTMRAFVYGGADADYKEDVPLNEWFHVVAVISDKKATLYLNGVVAATDTGSTTITIPSTPYLSLGVQTNSSNTPLSSTYFDGSIANFRLFNRNLTADEVYQLYAYQKEYFGHSTNNLTLKAGRLGIGTSEPRAALDVRGVIRGPGLAIQTVSSYKSDATMFSGSSVTDISGLSVTIQPKFANSKICVDYHILYGGWGRMFFRVKRVQGSTTSYFQSSFGPNDHASTGRATTTDAFDNNDASTRSGSFSVLDNAIGLEPITYTVQGWTYHSTYYVCVNRGYREGNAGNETYHGRGVSSITAQEVCQ